MGRGSWTETLVSASPGRGLTHGSAPTSRETGAVVADRYVLEAYLGKSRYGEVYKALDRSLSDPQLRLEHHVGLHLLGDEIRGQTRLLRKLESSYQQPHLWSHPNIVKIRGFGSDRGTYYLSMELLEGSSLRAVLEGVRPNLLPRARSFALLRAVGDALSYAHMRGVVHGDIRPEKIFVTTEGDVKVLDLLPGTTTRSTPFFVEDLEEAGLSVQDTRDDVYGLACLAYELLSGGHPFPGASPIDAVRGRLEPAAIAGLGLGRWEALAHGLALRRSERTSSVAEFLTELGIAAPETPRKHGRTAETDYASVVPESASRDADDDVPIVGDYSTLHAPHESAAHERQGPVALVVPHRGEHLAFSDPVISLRDVHAYLGYDRRREGRETKSRGAMGVALVATLGIVVYAAYFKYEELLRSSAEELVDKVANVVPPTSSSTIARAPEVPTSEGPGAALAAQTDAVAAPVPPLRDRAAEPSAPSPAETEVLAGVDESIDPPSTPAAQPSAQSPVQATALAPVGEESAETPGTDSDTDAAALEPPSFEFAVETVSVAESRPAAAISIRRRGETRGADSVTWWTTPGTAAPGTDYADLGPQVATFGPGQETLTIYVPIVSDSVAEARESFRVSLAAGGASDASLTPTAQAEVVIDDDD